VSEAKNTNKKIYFITGGGTGGHIYPAVAVADKLSQDKNCKIYYVGNPKNMEFSIIKDKGYEFLPVMVKGMPRKIDFHFIIWGCQLIFSILQSLYYLLRYKPNAIFGTGGYVSAPTVIAAMLFTKTPYMLHDCDAQPGIVTIKTAPKAKAVNLAFESAKKYINNKNISVFGNPIRDEFKTIDKKSAKEILFLENKITVCITGGSQGAQSINNATIPILKKLSQNNIQVIFQTGRKNFDKAVADIAKIYPEYQEDENIIMEPYFDNMSTIIKASDIIVSRSGSLSLSEICASPAASILIPYPHAAADHQRKNAKFMQDKGASIYLEDKDLNPESLANRILAVANDTLILEKLTNCAQKLSNLNACEDIVSKLKSIH